MNEKGKRLQLQQQEDATFNKLLICLGCFLVLEVLMLALQSAYIEFDNTSLAIAVAKGLNNFFRVYRFLGLPVLAAGVLWLVRAPKKTAAGACSAALLWLWGTALLSCGFNEMGVRILCALPIVLAVFCAVWFLYQPEFFVNTVLGGVGILALWVAREIYMSHPRLTWCGIIAVCAVMAVAAVLLSRLSKQGGKLFGVQLFTGKPSYLPMYLTCAVVAVVLVAAGLLNAAVMGMYAIVVLAAWLFCLAVYYTVKLV